MDYKLLLDAKLPGSFKDDRDLVTTLDDLITRQADLKARKELIIEGVDIDERYSRQDLLLDFGSGFSSSEIQGIYGTGDTDHINFLRARPDKNTASNIIFRPQEDNTVEVVSYFAGFNNLEITPRSRQRAIEYLSQVTFKGKVPSYDLAAILNEIMLNHPLRVELTASSDVLELGLGNREFLLGRCAVTMHNLFRGFEGRFVERQSSEIALRFLGRLPISMFLEQESDAQLYEFMTVTAKKQGDSRPVLKSKKYQIASATKDIPRNPNITRKLKKALTARFKSVVTSDSPSNNSTFAHNIMLSAEALLSED